MESFLAVKYKIYRVRGNYRADDTGDFTPLFYSVICILLFKIAMFPNLQMTVK